MTSEMTPKCFDLVLSSGFLAFARQVGFLGAIEEVGIAVGGICGTSSGALAGALWAAGVPAKHIGDLLKEPAPLRRVGLSRTPWRGLLDMAPEGRPIPGWNPLGQTMALALARREAGDEPGGQEAASIVRQRLGELRAAGVKTQLSNLAEALLAAFEHDRDRAITALKSAIQSGLRSHVLFSDPMFEELRDDSGYVALRRELKDILATEREKVLQLVCFHNPVPKEWQPLPETCEGVQEQQ